MAVAHKEKLWIYLTDCFQATQKWTTSPFTTSLPLVGYAAEVDTTPIRINVPAFDGWCITANGRLEVTIAQVNAGNSVTVTVWIES